MIVKKNSANGFASSDQLQNISQFLSKLEFTAGPHMTEMKIKILFLLSIYLQLISWFCRHLCVSC